jgi:hypothetical protein
MAKQDHLPPLPEPAMVINARQHNPVLMWDAYTAEQMRKYARAAISAALKADQNAPPASGTVD